MIPKLLGLAVLLPLFSFVGILLAGPRMGKAGSFAAWIATFAIGAAAALSLLSLKLWLTTYPVVSTQAEEAFELHDEASQVRAEPLTPIDLVPTQQTDDSPVTTWLLASAASSDSSGAHAVEAVEPHRADHDEVHSTGHHAESPSISGEWYVLGQFGQLKLTIGYFVDALTIAMFCMVTLIATCIHVYAMGYMHDELHDVTDHEIALTDGGHFTRPGRYHRFFQYMSLFCFSMLGLVVAGNVAMTFVFWELVGICSYFLIGFYVERPSASTAANKAFIVNRVGDFGMIIGLMALWGSLGTFAYGDVADEPGLFSLVRPASAQHALIVPDEMVRVDARAELAAGITDLEVLRDPSYSGKRGGYGYWLLCVAGIGIFCGCVGKSAQFPLHVWLPDAMEGPTPVSALVHSATMVAAGVFLVGRFYPVFTPDALFVIAVVGVITLFMAATIAITATDIKRVLAYSTVSQLGYMMLALGVGGWLAGIMHLFTHAFFKSLLFLCSGSVIHAVHTNEMTEMGGLRKKMPWTAYTMLIGCLAIAGAGIPFLIGFSGYYSKDAILEQALLFQRQNPGLGGVFFYAAAGGAAITAFYMFRLWYLTFAGQPRDRHRYEHAHESPPTMVMPLVLLSLFAVGVGWNPAMAIWGLALAAVVIAVIIVTQGLRWDWLRLPLGFIVAIGVAWWIFGGVALADLLEQARPAGTLVAGEGKWFAFYWPDEHASHAAAIAVPATLMAFGTAAAGVLLATVFYAWRFLDADDAKAQFSPIHRFLIHKWWFDELYDRLLVRPLLFLSRLVAGFDRRIIDGVVDGSARVVRTLASIWETIVDRGIVDGIANGLAAVTYAFGLALRGMQTGNLRQYVLFIVVGTIAVFVAVTFFWGYAFAS